jgi:hypothetical protein
MKRRTFLASSAGLGLAGVLYPILGRSQGTPCPPSPLSVSGGTSVASACNAGDAEADWLVRSTGPGVVWAHDFRDPDEVRAWRYTPNDGLGNVRADNGLDVQRHAVSGIGNSGMMVHTIRGTTLAQSIDATATTVFLKSVAEFPDPATVGTTWVGANRYLALMGEDPYTSEEVIVTARNVSNNSLTITRSPKRPQPHAAGGPFSVQDHTAWWRLMGAFSQANNGKTTPDIGIANGFKNFDTDYTAQTVNKNFGRFRGAYWGHSEYKTLYGPKWPINGYDAYTTNADRVFHDTYVGTEFWIQWRAKITGNRMENPNGKMCYLQEVSQARQQWFTNIAPEYRNAQRLNFVNDGQGRNINLANASTYSEGSNYQVRLNEWVTYMIHLRPGRNLLRETLVDLYVQEPEDTAWRHVMTSPSIDLIYIMPSDNVAHPPGYNVFSVLNYANHYEGGGSSGASRSTHAIQATQVILSSREIPIPRA